MQKSYDKPLSHINLFKDEINNFSEVLKLVKKRFFKNSKNFFVLLKTNLINYLYCKIDT